MQRAKNLLVYGQLRAESAGRPIYADNVRSRTCVRGNVDRLGTGRTERRALGETCPNRFCCCTGDWALEDLVVWTDRNRQEPWSAHWTCRHSNAVGMSNRAERRELELGSTLSGNSDDVEQLTRKEIKAFAVVEAWGRAQKRVHRAGFSSARRSK